MCAPAWDLGRAAGLVPCRGGQGVAAGPPPPSASPPHKPGLTHLLRATVKLSCAGCREPSPPRAGRQLGTPGRRLSGRRAPSREGSWLLRGCGGRAGRHGGMRCGWGDRERRAERTHRRDLLLLLVLRLLGPGLSRSHRLDPFQGRAPRTRRQVQRSASCGGCVGGCSSRRPARPGGPRGPWDPALLGKRAEKGKAAREVLSPHPAPG